MYLSAEEDQASRAWPIREITSVLPKWTLKGKVINPTKSRNSNQVIDGFVRSTASSPIPKNKHPRTAAYKLHQRTEKAQTLMRGSLKKPSIQVGHHIQRLAPGYNPSREVHAKNIVKHGRVQRFGNPISDAKPAIPSPPLKAEVRPRHGSTPTDSASTSVALPSMITSASHQKLERMLDVALTRADAHKQALRYHAARHFWQRPGFLGRRTGLKIALILIVVIAAVGFVSWQKFPQLSVKLAASRLHINASVPSYKPEGYSLAAPAQAINGQVLIKYKAAADAAQGYDISQAPSEMTSVSLANTLSPAGTQMQTSQVGGNTVYIYGPKNDAAWVNNGILYKLNDRANLSSDQIIEIVKGLN